LVGWFTSHGEIQVVGVEGTGSWGVSLARFLHDHEIMVIEVDRQNRQTRRRVGKSDPTDAVSAARAALSGSASVIPKTRNGPVEQIRVLMVAHRSVRSQRIETLNQLRHLVFTGPEEVRARFKDRYETGPVTKVAKMRPRTGSNPAVYTTMVTMRGLARRIESLNTETKALDPMLNVLVKHTAPSLVGL
jgi:transposase